MARRMSPRALLILVAIVLLGLTLRLQAVAGSEVIRPVRADARDYLLYAHNLRAFAVYSRANTWAPGAVTPPAPDAVRAPGYPLFVLPFLHDPPARGDVPAILYAQAVLGAGMLLLVFALGRLLLPTPLALGAAALAAGSALRAPELAGRVAELRRPYRGPLDYVIPYLRERYPDPSRLVIATNYEDPAFVFYLGSRVTVGFYAADLERDLQLLPDVIVARPWPDQLEVLEALASRARYAERRFPVANLRWNQTPSLSAPIGAGRGHRFRDPVIGVDGPELVILERIGDPAAAPAPGSAPAAR